MAKPTKTAKQETVPDFADAIKTVSETTDLTVCPPVLLSLMVAAQRDGTQASNQRERITSATFDVVKRAFRSDISPRDFQLKTCDENDFAHDRPITIIDDATGKETKGVERVKSEKKQPSTFKTLMSAAIKVADAGHDLTEFIDTYEGENDKLVTAVSKLRKVYKEIRDSEKDLVAEDAEKLLKKYKTDDILRLVDILQAARNK